MPLDPDPPIAKVTLDVIYASQLQQGADLAEIKGTLALMAAEMKAAREVQADHESRLRELKDTKATFRVTDQHNERIGALEKDSVSRRAVITIAGLVATFITLGLGALGFLLTIGDRLWNT